MKQRVKKRNKFVVPALFRKAGRHGKTNKQLRKKLNQKVKDETSY